MLWCRICLFLIGSALPVAVSAGTLSEALDQALTGDMSRALPMLDSLDTSKLSVGGRRIAQCIKDTFTSPPQVEALPPSSQRLVNAYRTYWQSVMLHRESTEQAERALLDSLSSVLPNASSRLADLEVASDLAKVVINKEGLFALTGRTSPYYELMIWRTSLVRPFRVDLPDQAIDVPVVFLDDFVSMGWAGYATCNRYHTGGWATRDSLFAVAASYDTTTESFRVSYLAHEGQHLLDYKQYPKLQQPELEYRAKLTEIALSDSTTHELIFEFSRRNGRDRSVPHHFANYWVNHDLTGSLLKTAAADASVDSSWYKVPSKRIRSEARRLLRENDSRLRQLGAATVSQFLPN